MAQAQRLSEADSAPRRPGVLSLWPIVGGVALAGAILGGLWSLGVARRPTQASQPTAPPVITVLPAPSASPIAASATPEFTSIPTSPTAPQEIPTPTGGIRVGDLVQVVGTGVEGLNVRAGPGVDQAVILLALDSEVFRVNDGPRETSGFVWWSLTDLLDPARGGWAVENYLQVVQGN